MTNLQDDAEKIEQFVLEGFNKFFTENGAPTVMGIYCCPSSGWISLNFNKEKTLEQTFYNCPDFEYVEYSLIDLYDWVQEYESGSGVWKNKTTTYKYNIDDGDEGLNIFIYNFLKTLILEISGKTTLPATFIQFLDSKIGEEVI
ncbi:MAG TPA: hypothetical protein VF691_22865 [Cytophagaceae bacterium]|jgi:hypothetical protein